MKTLILAAASAVAMASAASAATIYSEDFTGQNGDGIIGAPGVFASANGWTASAAGVVSGDRFSVSGDAFSGNDTNDVATWLSPIIDVSGFTALSLAMDFFEIGDHEGPDCGCGAQNVDYINLTVLLDGVGSVITNINGFGDGTFSLTGDLPDDNDFGATSFASMFADASTLQVRVDLRNTAGSEVMGFDNIVLTGDVAPVPLPAGGVLLLSGLAGAAALRKRKS